MNFLVTAGPTREPIDPVRYLSNRSSGKMGFAVARAAAAAGHAVRLVSGPVALPTPPGVDRRDVVTAAEMFAAVHGHFDWAEVLVMCAAVADFRPRHVAPQKIKKAGRGSLVLELEPTPDVLGSLRPRREAARADRRPRPLVVGFAAETQDLAAAAQRKLREKDCDLIVANDVARADAGFDQDRNEVTLHFRGGAVEAWPIMTKRAAGEKLVEICARLQKEIDL